MSDYKMPVRRCALALLGALVINNANAAPLLPNTVSDLQLWLDATDVNGNGTAPADGTEVTVWQDKSGNNNDAVQNGASNRPEFLVNGGDPFGGHSVVAFNSGGSAENESLLLPSGFLFNEGAFTLFLVHQTSHGAANANEAVFGPSNAFLTGLELLNASIISKPNQIRVNGIEKSAGSSGWDNDAFTVTTLTADVSATQLFSVRPETR